MISTMSRPGRRHALAHLDFRRIGALNIWQGTVVELLLQGLGEKDGQLGVVDELGVMLA